MSRYTEFKFVYIMYGRVYVSPFLVVMGTILRKVTYISGGNGVNNVDGVRSQPFLGFCNH